MAEKIKGQEVLNFLEGMKTNSKFEFIEDAKTDSKLTELIESQDLKVGNRDLGFFHNIYAITDKANKNKCILPKEAVEAGLSSIRQKPVNAEHVRTSVLGHYLGGYLKENEIHSYGCIYKSCFPDKWDEAKKLFKSNKLNTSFEIWCPEEKRTYNDDGTYSLGEIDIAGGALLFKEAPAEEEAKVLEVAKENSKNNDIVYAYKEEEMLKCSVEKNGNENARLYIEDIEWINRLLYEIECSVCKKRYYIRLNALDLEKLTAKVDCFYCGSKMNVDFMPKTKVTKKGKVKNIAIVERSAIEDLNEIEKQDIKDGTKITFKERKEFKDSDFALIQDIGNKKVRRFLISDENTVQNSFDRISKSFSKNINTEERKSVLNKIGERAKELKMKSITEKYIQGGTNMDELKLAQEKIEVLNQDITLKAKELETKDETIKAGVEELDKVKADLEKVKADFEDLKVAKEDVDKEFENVKAEIAKRDNQIKADTIKARKEELGDEYIKANSIKDEELLDNTKFENAKLKKENELLKKDPASAMVAGSVSPEKVTETKKAHDRVEKMAFNDDGAVKDNE